MNQPVVGFAGMSHLGLVSAAAVAGAGFETVCFDTDPELIASLRQGALPIVEPDLAELIKANGARQRFASSASELGHCDVVYVALDVTTDSEGRSDTSALKALIELDNSGDAR